MKQIIFIIALFISVTSIAQNQWVIKDSVNGQPRSVASSFVLEGEGYALCGLDIDGFRRKLYSYTYWQDDWDDEGSLGGLEGDGLERGSASAFAVGNKGYICLGQGVTNPFFDDLWEYDPVTNAWTQKADFIGSARRQGIGFAIDDYGYVGLGIDANGFCKDMYKYDPANNMWTQLNDFGGTARKEAVGFAMGGQGYVGTGDDGVLRKDFWQYEPTTDSWIQKTDFPGTARKGAVGWGTFPTAFICTGEDIGFNYTTDLWEFNYFSNTWIQRADFIGPGRTNAFAFTLNDLGFVGSGYGEQGFMKDVYAYRPILGIENLEEHLSINVYPNPSSDIVTIELATNNLAIELYSLDGKNVTSSISVEKTENSFTIKRGELPCGNYLLNIQHEELGNIASRKLVFL